MEDERVLHIYTDGSSRHKPRRGGIGIRFVYPDHVTGEEITKDYSYDGFKDGAIGEMELYACVTALKEALKWEMLNKFSKIVIYSDSMYISDNYMKSIFEWSGSGYKNRHGRPIANAKLWKDFSKYFKQLRQKGISYIYVEWVESHAKNIHNKAVDKLAKASSKSPSNKPLSRSSVRRKSSDKSVEISSVKMKSQQICIRIIVSKRLMQNVWEYKYEVISKTSKYYGSIDIIYCKDFLSTGHSYRVRFNKDQKHPQICKVYREINKKAT